MTSTKDFAGHPAGSLQMDPSMRQRVEHVTAHQDRPYLG